MGGAKTTKMVRLLLYLPLTVLVVEHIVCAFYWVHVDFPKHESSSSGMLSVLSSKPVHRAESAFVQPFSLATLTKSGTHTECIPPLEATRDIDLSQAADQGSGIPHIIHQTSKSRCLTPKFVKTASAWRSLPDWSYYLHDDIAVKRLLEHHYPDFPLLKEIVENCLLYGTLKSDLWRYLVLWIYGGIYADLDTVPAQWEPYMLDGEDAFFVVEQYHMLSQYFIAVSPRHPLMWYAIQHSLANLWKAPDTGRVAAALYTGPHALHQAYIQFRKDVGDIVEEARPGTKPVASGHFIGTQNRSVTIIGIAENQNQYINRDVIGSLKGNEYKKLGMTLHQEDRKHSTGQSCLSTIMNRRG